jgi:hypothetical protein
MRNQWFFLGIMALVVAACASGTVEQGKTETGGKLARLSRSELDATFAGLPQDGGPAQVPNHAAMELEDVYSGIEDNSGGQFDNNTSGIAPAQPSSGIFFNDHSLDTPVNFNQDIRGRFEHVYDGATDASTEQERIQRAGWIKLDVKKAIRFSAELRKLAAKFGAVVTSFKDNEVVWKMSGSKLESLIDYFDLLKDTEVLGYDFRSYDRTGDFYAVEARIKTAQTMLERLNKLAEKADKVEDLIKISEAIEHNMTRIDGLNAMLKDIERRAGTVEVRIVLED